MHAEIYAMQLTVPSEIYSSLLIVANCFVLLTTLCRSHFWIWFLAAGGRSVWRIRCEEAAG